MFDMKNDVTETGIKNLKNVSEEEFFAIGKTLSRIEHGLQWAVGDWYNAIPWGDKESACERAGLSYGTAHTYGDIASKFQIATRVANLSFKHHRVLAIEGLDGQQRAELLADAVEGGWSSAKLAKERDRLLGIEKPLLPAPCIDEHVDALLSGLPKSVSSKVKKDIKDTYDEMKKSYHKDVMAGVREKMKELRVDIEKMNEEAEEMMDAAVKMRRGVKAFMDATEYKIILGCLHSDRECAPARKDKAFQIFRRMGDEVFRVQ